MFLDLRRGMSVRCSDGLTCISPRRRLLCAGEVGDHVASGPPALLHRAQLCPAPLAPLVHGHIRGLHPVDRRLLLPHGLDGEEDPVQFLSALHTGKLQNFKISIF